MLLLLHLRLHLPRLALRPDACRCGQALPHQLARLQRLRRACAGPWPPLAAARRLHLGGECAPLLQEGFRSTKLMSLQLQLAVLLLAVAAAAAHQMRQLLLLSSAVQAQRARASAWPSRATCRHALPAQLRRSARLPR